MLTWNGIVTKYLKIYQCEVKFNKLVKAYIQSIVIQRTVESILTDLKREKVDISYGVRQHD